MSYLPGRLAWRRRFSRVLGCAVAAASTCLAVPGTSWADTSTGLTTDSAGLPLVSAAQLSPGHVLERCIVVTTPTAYASADLAMYVTRQGSLADHLNVTVESGQGGSFASCTGFAGRLVYVGTLAALAAGYSAGQPERVGHYSTNVSSVTLRLRFSVQDDNAAQGLTTTAAFWWLPIAPDTTPAPAPTTSSDPPATAAATTPAPSAAAPSAAPSTAAVLPAPTTSRGVTVPVTASPRPTRTVPPTGSPLPVRTLPEPPVATLAPPVGVPFSTGDGKKPAVALPHAGGGNDGTPDDSPAGIIGALAAGLGTGVASIAHTVSDAAAPALRGAAYTSLLILPLVLLFLVVQRVIDRRDPKLALAPSYADPFLGFVDRHRITDRPGDLP